MTGRIAGLALPALTGLFLAGPALAQPHLGTAQPVQISLLRIVMVLLVGVALAVVAIFWFRRRGGRIDFRLFTRLQSQARAIDIVETRRVSQHADLCLVRCGETEYFLLLLAGDARILSQKPVSPPVGDAPPCA